jgi:hypothetical protein
MQQISEISLHDCDFSLQTDDELPIRFAKGICEALTKEKLPKWVKLGTMYRGEADYDVISKDRQSVITALHHEHAGPTLFTPIPKFTFIYYLLSRPGGLHVLVGFQFEDSRDLLPPELKAKWDEFENKLYASTDTHYVDVTRKSWYRLQFRHYYKSLLTEVITARRELITNTRIALEIAEQVFSLDKKQPTHPTIKEKEQKPVSKSRQNDPTETSSARSLVQEQILSWLNSACLTTGGEAKKQLEKARTHVLNKHWDDACSSMWKAMVYRFYSVIKSRNNLQEWKTAASKLREIPNPYATCKTIGEIKRAECEPALYMVANELGWISKEQKNILDECKSIRNKSTHPSLGPATENDAFRMCSNLEYCIWSNKTLNGLASSGN